MNNSTTEQLFKALTAQVQTLEQIILDQSTLGFTHGRRFIYIQNTKRSLWSFIADDEPVKAVALTGYIVDLYRKEDEIPKLHIALRTREEEIVLCSGFETHFSRDVMAAIAQLTPEQAHRPLKIMPCLKEVKKRSEGADGSIKKPVYANVLLDDKTLYTHKLKQRFNADELFEKAQEVLTGKRVTPSTVQHTPASQPQVSLPKIPQSQSSQAKSSQAKSPQGDAPVTKVAPIKRPKPEILETQVDSVDWKAFCRQHGVLPGVLKALAQELGLPMGKLNPSQSATLYQQAYARFVLASVAS